MTKPDCAHLWDRPALLADHEFCAHAPGMTESAREAYMSHVSASVLDAVVAKIPDAGLHDRPARWLHLSPTDHAAVVADPPPEGNWAVKTAAKDDLRASAAEGSREGSSCSASAARS